MLTFLMKQVRELMRSYYFRNILILIINTKTIN